MLRQALQNTISLHRALQHMMTTSIVSIQVCIGKHAREGRAVKVGHNRDVCNHHIVMQHYTAVQYHIVMQLSPCSILSSRHATFVLQLVMQHL